jgi:hypothetical protein
VNEASRKGAEGPLSSSSDGPPWLIYAGGKKWRRGAAVLINQGVKSSMGNDPQGHFEADWSAAEGWKIGDRIKDQSWQQLALAWPYVAALCSHFGVAALSRQRVRQGR